MFSKYSPIENFYQKPALFALKEAVGDDEEVDCVFTEKVHGANLQVFVDEVSVKPARRTDFLGENESFQGAREFVREHEQEFRSIFKAITPTPLAISVCGEWFGGGDYPGHTGEKVSTVQKGVWYSPSRHFIAFDIRVFYDGAADGDTYVPWATFCALVDSTKLRRVQELHRMKVDAVIKELLEHNCIRDLSSTFESTIWKLLNETDPGPKNYAEGYVIRPVRCFRDKYGTRLIFKYKSPQFSEKAHQPPPPPPKDSALEQEFAVVEHEFLRDDVLRNRLNNVLSKESWKLEDNTVRGKIVKALAQDVADDAKKDYANYDWNKLEKRLGGYCGKFIGAEVTKALHEK